MEREHNPLKHFELLSSFQTVVFFQRYSDCGQECGPMAYVLNKNAATVYITLIKLHQSHSKAVKATEKTWFERRTEEGGPSAGQTTLFSFRIVQFSEENLCRRFFFCGNAAFDRFHAKKRLLLSGVFRGCFLQEVDAAAHGSSLVFGEVQRRKMHRFSFRFSV